MPAKAQPRSARAGHRRTAGDGLGGGQQRVAGDAAEAGRQAASAAVAGKALATAVAAPAPTIQSTMRSWTGEIAAPAEDQAQPHNATGTSTAMAPRPKSCIRRSATMAPGPAEPFDRARPSHG